MNWHLFVGFLAITFVLVLTPGPIVTLIISTGATRGLRPAMVTVAGTATGSAVLLTAIALGLNWVLTHALYLFEILRWAGAAYLIWLGVRAWRSAGATADAPPANHVHYWRGFLVALSNPKTIAFFTAFLPQFIDPTLPPGHQLFVLCAASVVIAAITDSLWAVTASMGRAWFMKPARARFLARASGLTLVGGGIWLSLARRPT